jgi:hypothetical protein
VGAQHHVRKIGNVDGVHLLAGRMVFFDVEQIEVENA